VHVRVCVCVCVLCAAVQIKPGMWLELQAGYFEQEVDKNSYDATDYTVLVTGLPRDAGFHEVCFRGSCVNVLMQRCKGVVAKVAVLMQWCCYQAGKPSSFAQIF